MGTNRTVAVVTLLSIALVLSVGIVYALSNTDTNTSEKPILGYGKGEKLDKESEEKLLPEDMPEAVNPKIDPLLQREIEKKPHEKIPVIIVLKEQQTPFDINTAKSFAKQSQQSLAIVLKQIKAENITQHWLLDAVSASILAENIGEIAARSDVKIVRLDRKVTLPEPTETAEEEADYGDYIIRADEMWDLGYYGDNIKIAILDTGIDRTHPMLDDLDDDPTTNDPKVIAWKCFTFEERPTDGYGHGTHCAGIAAGTRQEANVSFADSIMLASEMEINQSEVHTYILEVPEATARMMIDLSWWDSINDLDLTATDPVGYTYNGTETTWQYEYMEIEQPMEGNWTINVTGTNLTYTEYYYLYAWMEKTKLINITGVAPKALLLNGKVLTDEGWGFESWIIRGIEWAVDEDTDIISMSLGGIPLDRSGKDPMSMAVTNAWNSGVVVAVAAGNAGEGEASIASPACAEKAIAIATSDVNDIIAFWSSRGPTSDGRVGIDVTAPGVEVWSSVPWGYEAWSGTSMSTPHVAGASALLLQAYPGLTPEEVEKAMKNGAEWLAGMPMHSGNHAWFSGSCNNLNNMLDHQFNLTAVSSATLKFWTRYGIESWWDFGYVKVSTDGGLTWNTLDTYTDYQMGWTEKNYDLTPYVGNDIILRFEYITDFSVCEEGWYVDDIEIPEIGFSDDVESGPGSWIPNGWTISEPKPYDVYEQGSGRLDVKGAYDALTSGTLVNPSQWFAGVVYPGGYTETFTVINNHATNVTVTINKSNMADTQDKDSGDWITQSTTSLTVPPAGGSATFNATMNVPGTAKGAYKGRITVNDGVKDLIIPVSVNIMENVDNTTVEDINGTVDEYWQLGDCIYYTLDVQQGVKNLTLTLNWTSPENDLDLYLVNPEGMPTAYSWGDYPESVSVDNPESGNWTAMIHTWYLNTSIENYTLTINATGQNLLEITDFTIEPEKVNRGDLATFEINITNKETSAMYGYGWITIWAITEYGREYKDELPIEGTLSPGENTWTKRWDVWPSPGSYEATTQIYYYYGAEERVVEKTISFNIIIQKCGDVNCDEAVDMSDVIDLLYYVGYPGQYTICNQWSADVNCDKQIDMSDVIDLLYYVGYPGQYELKCCCIEISG